MILNIHGKHLAFGMHWRTLTGGEPPRTLAARLAREVKASRIWHDDSALHMGYLAAEDARAKVADKIYSAAAALARLPRVEANALLVYRLSQGASQAGGDARSTVTHSIGRSDVEEALHPDADQGIQRGENSQSLALGSAAIQPVTYLVCGIVKRRPRVGFDRVVQEEAELASLMQAFAQKADGRFWLMGNQERFGHLLDAGTVQFVRLELDELAEAADSYSVLHRPNAAPLGRKLVTLTACAAVAVAGAQWGMTEYRAYQLRKHPPAPEKTPAERYAEDIERRSAAPTARAAVLIPAFANWFASSVPVITGGWLLSTIKCHQLTTPVPVCELTYKRDALPASGSRGATNATFLSELPARFGAPIFGKDDNQVTVTARPDFGGTMRLSELLAVAPTSADLRETLGSSLQSLRPAATKAVLHADAVFGAIPPEGLATVPEVYRLARWEVQGPLRNAEAMAHFSPHMAITSLSATVRLETDPTIRKSKFEMHVAGDAYAKDRQAGALPSGQLAPAS